MEHAGTCIGNVSYDSCQLQRVHKLDRHLAAAFQSERDNAAGAVGHVLLCQCVILVVGQSAIVHPCHFVVFGKVFGYFLGIAAVLRHAQVQSFQTEVQQERILRRLDAAEVAHQLRRCFSDVSQFAESFCISQSVIRFVRCAETGEFVGMCFPVEIAAVYNCSAYAGGVSVHIFGSGVDYYIGSPFKRAAVDRSGESIVYNQRYAVLVGDTGKLFDVENFQRRVGDCFAEQGFGVRTESGRDFLFGRIGVDKRYIDTQLFHCHAKQVERSAIDSG